jgi:hypothetical protein
VVAEGTWIDDPNNSSPPPSTVDGYIRLPIEDGNALDEEGYDGSISRPYILGLDNKAYEVRTLTVSNVAARLYYGGGPYPVLNLSNTSYAIPSLVIGDSAGAGYAQLELDENTRLQSFGFADIGAPAIPGLVAEGVLFVNQGAAWFHDGLISIGAGGGAGHLHILGEVSGGLSGRQPNVFVSRNHVTRGLEAPVFPQLWIPSPGRLFANELVVEGNTQASGAVSAELVQIRNGGLGGFGNLDTGVLEVGNAGIGTAYISGFADHVIVGRDEGGNGTLRFGAATIGSPDNGYYVSALELGLNGGIALVDGGGAVVNGATRMADMGGTVSLQVTGGREFIGNGQIRAAIYPDYAGGSNRADILVEGEGSRLAAQELWLAANENTQFYGGMGPGAAGTASLTVRNGGLVEIGGRTDVVTFSSPFGSHTTTNYTPGLLVAGVDSVISGDGTIRVTNPDPASDGQGTLHSFGTLSPGNSPGWLTIDGDLSLAGAWSDPGGRLRIELGGSEPGTGYDVLEVSGDLDLTGAILELFLWGDFDPDGAVSFDFLRVHGAIHGGFAALQDHTGWGLSLSDLQFGTNGIGFNVDPSGGASPVPVPPSLLLWASALVTLAGYGRRRAG